MSDIDTQARTGARVPARSGFTDGTASCDRRSSGFDVWVEYFRANPVRQRMLEDEWDASAPVLLTDRQRDALVRSFQRFELGEGGDGRRLLSKAEAARDPVYTHALELLVGEEQKHSALFGLGLRRMGAPSLSAHWSDFAFTRLRRMLGLRTEIALFLIAEAVAVEYFEALADAAPDEILRGIGERIRTDEREHLRFQVDRLRVGFSGTSRLTRATVGLTWWIVAVGAATVLCTDHGAALRVCGREPLAYWGRALRRFRRLARAALWAAPPDGEPRESRRTVRLLGPGADLAAVSTRSIRRRP